MRNKIERVSDRAYFTASILLGSAGGLTTLVVLCFVYGWDSEIPRISAWWSLVMMLAVQLPSYICWKLARYKWDREDARQHDTVPKRSSAKR